MSVFRRTAVLAFIIPLGCTQVDLQSAPAEPPPPPPSCTGGMRLSPASVALFVGDTMRFSLTSGGCSSLPQAVRWYSGNAQIAEVDSVTGLVRGKSVGSITITAIDVADRNEKTAAALQVVSRP
jgi:uncharacterized protein YjdB